MTKKRLSSFSILRFWRTPPGPIREEEGKDIERRRKAKPIELGIIGIITWPFAIFRAILEAIKSQAEEEQDIEAKTRKQFLELRMRYESGEITEQEYKEKEAKLSAKLKSLEKG